MFPPAWERLHSGCDFDLGLRRRGRWGRAGVGIKERMGAPLKGSTEQRPRRSHRRSLLLGVKQGHRSLDDRSLVYRSSRLLPKFLITAWLLPPYHFDGRGGFEIASKKVEDFFSFCFACFVVVAVFSPTDELH